MAGNGESSMPAAAAGPAPRRRAASPAPQAAAGAGKQEEKAKEATAEKGKAATAEAGAVHPVFIVLKAGGVLNLVLLWNSLTSEVVSNIRVPAQIFFCVSAYRCVFPNRYKNGAVLHDTILSSSLITRLIATVTEISWIYQLSYIARDLEVPAGVQPMAKLLGWLMLAQCAVSQVLVWLTVISGVGHWMFWEEVGWAVIFILNTIVSWWGRADPRYAGHVHISLVYACLFLPYHFGLHLPALYRSRAEELNTGVRTVLSWKGLHRAATVRMPTRNLADFGGFVGAVWMVGYWVLLPLWHAYLVS